MDLKDVKVGMRVAIHPATDHWMRGDRFGEVVKIGRTRVVVKMDSNRVLRLSPWMLEVA